MSDLVGNHIVGFPMRRLIYLHSVPAPNVKAPALVCCPKAGFCSVSPPNSFLLTGVCTLSDLLVLVVTGVEATAAAAVWRMKVHVNRQEKRLTFIPH